MDPVDNVTNADDEAELTSPEFHHVRTCKECGKTKTLSQFVKSKGSASGYRWQCTACFNGLAKAYRKGKVNTDGWKDQQAQARERKRMELDAIATARREALLTAQNGACAVCGTVSHGPFYHLDVTQDGTWLGLICPLCTPVLHAVRTNAARVEAARLYCERVSVL